MACYWNGFTFLYVDDVRTSQETQASTTCYGIVLLFFSFFFVDNVHISQETHLWTPRPVTEIAVLFAFTLAYSS
jgi:hypothetical protein